MFTMFLAATFIGQPIDIRLGNIGKTDLVSLMADAGYGIRQGANDRDELTRRNHRGMVRVFIGRELMPYEAETVPIPEHIKLEVELAIPRAVDVVPPITTGKVTMTETKLTLTPHIGDTMSLSSWLTVSPNLTRKQLVAKLNNVWDAKQSSCLRPRTPTTMSRNRFKPSPRR